MDWISDDGGTALPKGAEVPMQQHPAYAATLRALGRTVRRYALGKRSAPLATALVLERRVPVFGTFRLLSRGPVFAPCVAPAERGARVRALRERLAEGASPIVTADLVGGSDPMADAGWLMTVTPYHAAEWTLAREAGERRAGLHQKWRNRLVRAERSELHVRERTMSDDPGHWLYRADRANARARRYAALPPAFGAAWARTGDARLFTAERDGRRVAAALILMHPPGATYHVAWASEEGRAIDAPRLLLWRAAARLAKEGVTVFDLGSLETEQAPGLARFKLGTGARAVAMGATWMRAPGTAPVAALQRWWEGRGTGERVDT